MLHTRLSDLSQHLVGGACVTRGCDPNAEVLAARHTSHGTAVGGRAAVVGFSSVALRLHSVRQSSGSRVPGRDQHVSVTLGCRPHIGRETRGCKWAVTQHFRQLISLLLKQIRTHYSNRSVRLRVMYFFRFL